MSLSSTSSLSSLIGEVQGTLFLLGIDLDIASVETMRMQLRCNIFQKLFRIIGIEIKSGTTKQQLMRIPTRLKEVHIECKRTWFMDVRPCQQMFIVILQICELIMERQLKDIPKFNSQCTAKDLISTFNAELNIRIENVSHLQQNVSLLQKSVNKLHEANKNPILSLDYIRATLDKMDKMNESTLAECKHFSPHLKYQLEYPQVKDKHPLLKNLMLNGDYNASTMVKILTDTLDSTPIAIPELSLQTEDIDRLLQRRSELNSSVNKTVLENLKIDKRPHFERIEI